MPLHWSRIAAAALVGALLVPARSILAQSNSTAAALNHASEVYSHVTTARGTSR